MDHAGVRMTTHLTRRSTLRRSVAGSEWMTSVRRVRASPHLIDDDSGVGRQLPVADVDGDGRIDVVIANKKGHFYFKNVAE